MEKKSEESVKTRLLLIVGILCILASIIVYIAPWEKDSSDASTDWKLTLTGPNGTQKIMSYDEITHLPAYTGFGGFFSTAGLVYGPYKVKGVPLKALCDLVGGITPLEAVFVSATDGYSMVFNYDQVTKGVFDTYDPKTMKVVSHETGELDLVLMYQQDGKPLSHDDGKPFRIATAGTQYLLVEGHNWVKWVDKIEVEELNTD